MRVNELVLDRHASFQVRRLLRFSDTSESAEALRIAVSVRFLSRVTLSVLCFNVDLHRSHVIVIFARQDAC